MTEKMLVVTRSAEDAERARATGATVLAEYPNGLLVRATDDQAAAMTEAGLDAQAVPTPPVRVANATFSFTDAMAPEEAAPPPAAPARTAYVLVQLVGPVKEEWIDEIAGLGGLGGLGGTVHGGLNGFRLIVGLRPDAVPALRELAFVEDVAAYRPTMKVSPRLRPDVPDSSLSASALREFTGFDPEVTRQVQITMFDGEDPNEVATAIGHLGGKVLLVEEHDVLATVPATALIDLAERPGVQTILPYVFPTTSNDRAATIMSVPVQDEILGKVLTGAGQVVGVIDSGCDTGDPATVHADLAGRVSIVSSPNVFGADSTDPAPFDDGAKDENGHGTHVCGSVAGNGAAAQAAGSPVVPMGVAPEARLHFIAVGQRVNWKPEVLAELPGLKAYGLWGLPPTEIGALFQIAYDAGARIHTNSWGSSDPSVAGTYTEKSRAVDAYMAGHRDALVIFSAGNDGGDGDGDVQIDADSISPPATAKNCLTVGATENDRPHGSAPATTFDFPWSQTEKFQGFDKAGHVSDNPHGMALFSSRGPTDDGRLKPEVVAPGTNVLSARTSAFDPIYVGMPQDSEPLWGDLGADAPALRDKYCWSGGTSMATPLVAGAAALVRQYLIDERGHHPSGALLKAFLVNGAEPVSGQYPSEIPDGRNNVSGFGRVNVTASVVPGAHRPAFSDFPELAVGSMQIRVFRVSSAGAPLKVTLTWTDAPSPVPSSGALQNELYLRVRPVGGGSAIDGDTTPFATATNPTQQVVIANPAADEYFIEVHGITVVARSAGDGAPAGLVQDFALVVSNAFGTFGIPDLLDEPVEP